MSIKAERPSQLMLSYRQCSQLERKARDNYPDTLSVFIEESVEKEGWDDSSKAELPRILAGNYFSFCQSLNIANDRFIRTMTLILLKKDIVDLRYIPDDWYELLSSQSYPGHIRIHELTQQELGFIPQQKDKRVGYMTSPSSAAGEPCVECGISDPCISDAINGFPETGEKHFWSKKRMVRSRLLDDDFGCDGIITITHQCDDSGTHEAWLEEELENSRKILQPFGKPNNVILHYEGFKGGMNIIDAFHSPWEHLSSATMPHDALYESAYYTVRTDSCCEHNFYVEIKVYPSLETRFITGLSYEVSSSQQTRTIKDRRDEQRKAREATEDTKPKGKSKLQSGWTNITAEFELFRKASLTIELGLKVANVGYTYKYVEEIKELRQIKQLGRMSRTDALAKSTNKYFAPDPDSKDGMRKYALFGAKIGPVTLGISYTYQYTGIKDGLCHFYGLYGAPFFKTSFRPDIISFICAYCKMEDLASRCREYLRKHGTGVEYYIEISPEVNLDLGAVYSQKDKAWELNTKESNIKLGLRGKVSVTFETSVFVMKLKSKVGASIKVEAGFGFDKRDDGMDPVLFHDGVTDALRVKVGISRDDKDRKENSEKLEKEDELKWQLCKLLEVDGSSLWTNLYGRENTVGKKVAPVTQWQIGTDY